MIAILIVLLPLISAGIIYLMGKHLKFGRFLFLFTAVCHSICSVYLLLNPEAALSKWDIGKTTLLGFDPISALFLLITSLLFILVAIQTHFWLPAELAAEPEHAAAHGHTAAGFQKESVFRSCLLAFLAMMTLVTAARNLGILWVALEATTLVSAPLICFRRSAGSVEAMWKYLLICSVGIAMALFGTMLLDVAASSGGHSPGLNFDKLLLTRSTFHTGWFKAAFIFAIAGYGAKMGLAPFHTWLPDAHSEAPGTVSALLSGSLLNCSFLALMRFYALAPETLRPFCKNLMIAGGLFSLGIAAFFILRQNDFKRMLAYSSVEHMGLAAILWAIGCDQGALFHVCGHSLIKMTLFLIAGNILLAYGTRAIPTIGGMFKDMPKTACFWLIGILFICGMPPSPLFVTEYLLIREAGPLLSTAVLLLLFVVFGGMTKVCLSMLMGHTGSSAPLPEPTKNAERLNLIPLVALIAVTCCGIMWLILLNNGEI